ncbi:MAG: PQQ-dependent sugar dehydrogenase [Planctomycetia bacterium]|nr:PQQ-dependent sugar dehydrogenase [Planctomycetia bacterium]
MMRSRFRIPVAVCCTGAIWLALAASLRAAPNGPAAFDTRARVPWTMSQVVGRPDPPLPFRVRRVFERVPLKQPLFFTHEPGTGRLLVVEQQGRIVAFPNRADSEAVDLFLDTGRETYSLTFDPKYADNRYVYVFSNGPRDATKKQNRIARFEVSREPPQACLPASEKVIIEFESNGHNGGDLAFGPDGCLYISAGDGTSDSDTNVTGQDLSDLVSAILRIDLRRTDEGRNYAIPRDNPFVEQAGARGEIWAYGLRNPWRIAFDRESGRLWVGDVGQDVREIVHVIQRGGNYGWSVEEGGQPFHPGRARGPTPILPPVAVHPHSEARSMTGGRVYHGSRLADLRGAYVYGDYSTGRVWGLRYDGQRVTWQRELADTTLAIVAIGEDADGELHIVDHAGGIYRLEPNEATAVNQQFPRKLSETGLFADVAGHAPAAGLIPYSVNSALWSDGALKDRLIALPGEAQIEFVEAHGWNFPDGAVIVKTFSFETRPGDAASRRRVETRLLVREQGEWTGYSYQWNDEQTDAELVPAAGCDRELPFAAEGAADEPPGQKWHFPSRAECMMCHTRAANYVLGLSTPQMNRAHNYGGEEENQLAVLERLGAFKAALPKRPAELPALADPRDASADLAARARSYLHANCAHCHVMAGGGNARIDLDIATPFEKSYTLGERPLHETFGVERALLVAPGEPERSVLLSRLERTGRGRMPPLSTSVVDRDAASLLREWIAGQQR